MGEGRVGTPGLGAPGVWGRVPAAAAGGAPSLNCPAELVAARTSPLRATRAQGLAP